MNICVLFLDNEKRSLRDTGREKSKQLERERERMARGAQQAAKATRSCLDVINEITAG